MGKVAHLSFSPFLSVPFRGRRVGIGLMFVTGRSLQQFRQSACTVMRLLIVDVARYLLDFVLTQRQNPVTSLPHQLETGSYLLVHAVGGRAFDLADEIAHVGCWRQADEKMDVIGHSIVANWPTAAPFRLFIDDLQQLRSVIAAYQGNTRMSRPGEVIEQLVEDMAHCDRSPAFIPPLKGLTGKEKDIMAFYPTGVNAWALEKARISAFVSQMGGCNRCRHLRTCFEIA
jgi:hypothetical protein